MALFTTCENKTDLAWEKDIWQCPSVFSEFGMAYRDEYLENWQYSMHSEGSASNFWHNWPPHNELDDIGNKTKKCIGWGMLQR